jgi:lysophospholipase L1-like esterase
MNAIGGWTDRDAAQVAATLDWAWPEGRCTVWVLPASVRHPGLGDDKVSSTDPDTAAVVAGIRALAPAQGVRIADWDSYAADKPYWYAEDGVHHTEAGKEAFAAFVVDRTRRHCGF